MQTTRFFWGNQTYESEVQGFFITVSGSLVQYYRRFRYCIVSDNKNRHAYMFECILYVHR